MKEKGGGRQEKEVRGGGLQSFFLLPEKKPFGFRNRLLPAVTINCLIVAEEHFLQDKVHIDQI